MNEHLISHIDFNVELSIDKKKREALCLIYGTTTSPSFNDKTSVIEEKLASLEDYQLTVDIGDLRYINSRFISMMIALRQRVPKFTIRNPTTMFKDLLSILGIQGYFEYTEIV